MCYKPAAGRHGVFTTGSNTVYEGNPDAVAVPLPAFIAEILRESAALHLEIPLRLGTYVARAIPVYCALGTDPLDDAEVSPTDQATTSPSP